ENIPSWDVEGPAERDGEVGEVAADTLAALEHVHRGGERVARAVLELDVVMDPIADRLHPGATRFRLAEELPGPPHQLVRKAVAAREREVEELARDLVDRALGCRGGVQVGLVRYSDHSVITQNQLALRHDEAF